MRNFKLIALTASLGLGIAWGCGASLSELLLDALCEDDGDCAPSQNCVRTGYQITAGAQGWCRDDNSCAVGSQPGCDCLPNGATFECNATTETNIEISVPATGCQCVFTCSDVLWPGAECPQGLVKDEMSGTSGSQCVCKLPQ